ncbi:MAG: hypothetical protein K2Q18_12360 [Bdellovibrionales bacterium]|nr:hypothetical protein [Bdellovibrionales bacterium]
MKKFLSALLLAVSFSAMAEPVYLYPSCRYGIGNNGECTLTNTSGKDISCNVNVTGFTRSGKYVTAYEYGRYLYSGMMTWINVYNPYLNDPITSLNANANCNTTR